MSKILDKIKKFEHSLTTMFQVNEKENVNYLNPNTEDAKKLEAAMKPAVDRIKALEEKRKKDQKDREDWLNNSREGDVAEYGSTSKTQGGQVQHSTRLSTKPKSAQSKEMSSKTKKSQSKGIDIELEQ